MFLLVHCNRSKTIRSMCFVLYSFRYLWNISYIRKTFCDKRLHVFHCCTGIRFSREGKKSARSEGKQSNCFHGDASLAKGLQERRFLGLQHKQAASIRLFRTGNRDIIFRYAAISKIVSYSTSYCFSAWKILHSIVCMQIEAD